MVKEDFLENKDIKKVKVFNGVCSITGIMSQIVSLADTGSNPAVHPNLCFGGENGYITQRYER